MTYKNNTLIQITFILLLSFITFFSQGKDTLVHPTAKDIPYISAHRGGMNYEGYPENAIETFEYVLTRVEAMIEFDVSMTKDSVLVLMHDKTIDRTTTGKGNIKELTWQEIYRLHLIDNFGNTSNYHIPTFDEAIKWAKENDVVLSIDVKRGVPFDKVLDIVSKYKMEGNSIIITYSFDDAQLVQALSPITRISVSIRSEAELKQFQKYDFDYNNIVAFLGLTTPSMRVVNWLTGRNIPCVMGTLGELDKVAAHNQDDKIYLDFIKSGVRIIATDRPIEASRAIAPLTSR